MTNFRGGLIGCGFFALNHLHSWKMVDGAEIVALCDVDAAKREGYSAQFGIPKMYGSVEEMLANEKLDFVDIVTQANSHRMLVELAAKHGVHVICQKPLAPGMDDAQAMVDACKQAGVSFMVHENFRFQVPMMRLKEEMQDIGELFWGRIYFRSNYNVYAEQPYLAKGGRYVIYDLGVHLLDLARYYMGEVEQLYCQIQRINPAIAGEDVATVMLQMKNGATCLVELSLASQVSKDVFPQTLLHLEGRNGSVSLGADFRFTKVKDGKVTKSELLPNILDWSFPPAQSNQESVYKTQQHWADCMKAGRDFDTSGEDNLKTLELVFGAYESAEAGKVYRTVL